MKYKFKNKGIKMSGLNKLNIHRAEELLQSVPRSVRIVFEVIKKSKSPIKPSDLVMMTKLTDRTIRSALSRLYYLQLVIKVPDLNDLRSHYLQLAAVA
jgi:DNA-binding transcriptional ArsR family regulator